MVDPNCSGITQEIVTQKYYIGLFLGGALSSIIWAGATMPQLTSSKSRMRSKLADLIYSNNGIVTPTDLVIKAKVTPEKAIKFLSNFAQKLQVQAEVDEETGARFYRFKNADQINKQIELKKITY